MAPRYYHTKLLTRKFQGQRCYLFTVGSKKAIFFNTVKNAFSANTTQSANCSFINKNEWQEKKRNKNDSMSEKWSFD